MTDYSAWLSNEIFYIQGSVDGILLNQPVKVKVFWKPGMAEDFRDIRFSLNDTNKTNLPYFMENYQKNGVANFIIKGNIPASPENLECKMYYNNVNAVSESNPDNVYLIYDDFDEALLDSNKWSLDSGVATISNGILNLTNDTNNWLGITSAKSDMTMCSVEMKLKTANRVMVGLTGQHSTQTGDVIVLLMYQALFYTLTCIGENCDDHIALPDFNDYHIVRFDVNTETQTVETFYDGISKGVTGIDVPTGPFQFMATQLTGSMDIDFIKILKFTPNPPLDIVIGEEFKVPSFDIYDLEGNKILHLLFETMYPKSVLTKKIRIKSKDFNLRNIKVQLGSLDPKSIPDNMKYSSENSYEYMQLSEDDITYFDMLEIAHLDMDVYKEIYIKCTVPAYVRGGNFMCGLVIQAEL